ncbi:MAG: pyridine nucleotide-disulfide oxidoreductase [Actinotalea sp.]|nr:pyridine nucleotide-disulfide oxidoreductase [Actinotalea sp.]
MTPPRSVVVVGAGLAGAQAAAALRAQGFTGHLTVLGAEDLGPYDRPPLSKELLARDSPAWLATELGADVAALADTLRLGAPARALDVTADGITVTTDAGAVTADAAVLATGAHAVLPPAWGAAATLHTWPDAVALRSSLVPGTRLVIVGAGWIGAEVAGVAARAGVDVTVVEAAGAPLAGAIGLQVGALTVPWYAAAGVRLLTGASVVGVGTRAVELADGEVLPADVVLAAVGARPTSAWLSPLALAPDGSVLVDEAYRVLGEDGAAVAGGRLVAVGDLARRRSPRHGWVPGGHWDGALRSPAAAVRSLLAPDRATTGGAPTPVDDPAPYVFSTQLGHELASFGHPGHADDVVLRGDPAQDFTALWFTAGTDELTAVLAVDRPRDVAAGRRLFTADRLPHLDRSLAADPDAPLRSALRPG